jgi:hypothetical protein
MALHKCQDCGKDISTYATACPHCGKPAQQKRRKTGCLGLTCCVVFIALVIILSLSQAHHQAVTAPSTMPASGTYTLAELTPAPTNSPAGITHEDQAKIDAAVIASINAGVATIRNDEVLIRRSYWDSIDYQSKLNTIRVYALYKKGRGESHNVVIKDAMTGKKLGAMTTFGGATVTP